MAAGRVIDVVAHQTRLNLNPRRPRRPLAAIGFEGRLDVAGGVRHLMAQTHRVFHRHAGALRHVLQRGVGRIAEQHHAAVAPIQDRIAIAQHPFLPIRAMRDDFLRARMHMLEAQHHLLMRHRLPCHRLRRVIVIGDDEVERLPAGERVMHDVAFRPGPEGCGVPAQIFRHLLGRDHRAIGGVPRHPRGVAHHLRANFRPQPICAHQGGTGQRLA